MSTSRLVREVEFHERALAEETRAKAKRFYAVAATGKEFYRHLSLQDCRGKRILECGCGTGVHALALARAGARVVGIDLASTRIDLAQKRAIAEGLKDRLSFQVMDVEALAFSDRSFDLVCGSGILHHLDLERALDELTRVLKPQGSAVFFEPLGHNPLINLYRRFTPAMRSADEHPLFLEDLGHLAAPFGQAEFYFFGLATLLAIPFTSMPGSGILLKILEAVDRVLFRIPFFKKQAWIAVISLSIPRTKGREEG